MTDTEKVEIPAYDSCKPCEKLARVQTTIGPGYGCEICQMTFIQVDKGAYIPFDQAMKLFVEKQRRAEARKERANQKLVAKPPKKKRKRKKVRH